MFRLAALHELLDIDNIVVKVNTYSDGVQVFGTCGGLNGGIALLDYFFGRAVENI